MTTYTDGDRIRRRMSVLRGRIDMGVTHWTNDAQRWFDWRHYVREFPIATLATAALIAFWLMPGHKKPQKVRLDSSTIEELIRRGGIQIESVKPRRKTWVDSTMSLLGSMLFRGAIAFIGQHLGRDAGTEAAEATEDVLPV